MHTFAVLRRSWHLKFLVAVVWACSASRLAFSAGYAGDAPRAREGRQGLPGGATSAAAARFLDQSSFGPTDDEIRRVQRMGLASYLREQLAMKPTMLQQFSMPVPPPCDSAETCWGAVWWKASLTAPDQLRQRMAFAISHIYVTSTRSVGGYAMVPYYNILIEDAFSNWRKLMEDVALSPTMGVYLDMVNSAKAPAGEIANENFARESLQLFTTGTVLLNPDGTPKRDRTGAPVAAYSQAEVQAFARAFTGWTFAPADGSRPKAFSGNAGDYTRPMVAVTQEHDTGPKRLLNGRTLPAGQTAERDLQCALDDLFASPNLPPFVCRQLIQHLVTSDPSPQYVERVVRVFLNNGSNVRGDMKAVIAAILLDPEARAGDRDPRTDGGHLREPLLFMTGIMRALHYAPDDPKDAFGYWTVSWASAPAGEAPMQSPSVFYYYSPLYELPGSSRAAPEFGSETVASVSARKVLVDQLVDSKLAKMHLDKEAFDALVSKAREPDALVDELNFLFLHSQMPDQMKHILTETVAALPDPAQRVRVALYLTLTSSQYAVCH